MKWGRFLVFHYEWPDFSFFLVQLPFFFYYDISFFSPKLTLSFVNFSKKKTIGRKGKNYYSLGFVSLLLFVFFSFF